MSLSKKKVTRENMDNFLNLMKSVGNDVRNDGSGLADFKPPINLLLTKQPDISKKKTSMDSEL